MLDVIVLTLVAISTVLAFLRGFAKEALAVLNWIGAALMALYAYPLLKPVTLSVFGEPILATAIAGLVPFLVGFAALSVVTHYLCREVERGTAGTVNRVLGLVFGLLRGWVLVSVMFLLMSQFVEPADEPPWIANALSRPYLAQGAEQLWSMVPDSVAQRAISVDGMISDDVQ